jgi:aspartyl-tRNA(Asn)/glutamyl-tRNA(Gln) amidotransferase subunit A
MRPCLRQRGTTLGPHRLTSRFLGTTVTQASWRRVVEEKNASVNALVYVVPDDAPSPVSREPLNGMTVAVKDNICTKIMPTTCSSAMLRGNQIFLGNSSPSRTDFDPSCGVCLHKKTDFQSPYDATVVHLLNTSGATIIGKTNCDEFGMG